MTEFPKTSLSELLGPDVTLVPAPAARRSLTARSGQPGESLTSSSSTDLALKCFRSCGGPHLCRNRPMRPGGRVSVAQHVDSLSLEPLLATRENYHRRRRRHERPHAAGDGDARSPRLPVRRTSRVCIDSDHGSSADVERILAPCVGAILWGPWGDAIRTDGVWPRLAGAGPDPLDVPIERS